MPFKMQSCCPANPSREQGGWVVNPYRRREVVNNGLVRMFAPMSAKGVEGPPVLEAYLAELEARGHFLMSTVRERLSARTVDQLVSNSILIPSDTPQSIMRGLVSRPFSSIGRLLQIGEIEGVGSNSIVFMHAPIASTLPNGVPVARGGEAVRRHLALNLAQFGTFGSVVELHDYDFGEVLKSEDIGVFDLGDVLYSPAVDLVEDIGERLRFLVRKILEQGSSPVILGGDHSQAFFTSSAMADVYGSFGVLQFDAHTDMYTYGNSEDSRLSHGNVITKVCQMDHVVSVVQAGIRDVFTQEIPDYVSPKVAVVSAREISLAGHGRLLSLMDPTIPWFITFDVDSLLFSDVPSTATPVLGGLEYYRTLEIFNDVCRKFDVKALEFVEIGENQPSAHGTAAVAARLALRYIFARSRAGN